MSVPAGSRQLRSSTKQEEGCVEGYPMCGLMVAKRSIQVQLPIRSWPHTPVLDSHSHERRRPCYLEGSRAAHGGLFLY